MHLTQTLELLERLLILELIAFTSCKFAWIALLIIIFHVSFWKQYYFDFYLKEFPIFFSLLRVLWYFKLTFQTSYVMDPTLMFSISKKLLFALFPLFESYDIIFFSFCSCIVSCLSAGYSSLFLWRFVFFIHVKGCPPMFTGCLVRRQDSHVAWEFIKALNVWMQLPDCGFVMRGATYKCNLGPVHRWPLLSFMDGWTFQEKPLSASAGKVGLATSFQNSKEKKIVGVELGRFPNPSFHILLCLHCVQCFLLIISTILKAKFFRLPGVSKRLLPIECHGEWKIHLFTSLLSLPCARHGCKTHLYYIAVGIYRVMAMGVKSIFIISL